MKQNIILFLSVILLISGVNAQNVEITSSKIEKNGDDVTISFDIKAEKISTNYMLTFTPVIWNGEREESLRSIVVVGRNRAIIQRRNGLTVDGVVIENNSLVRSYEVSAPFEEWMGGASIRIDRELEGCCGGDFLSPIALSNNILKPTLLPIIPLFERDIKAYHLDKFHDLINDYPFVAHVGSKSDDGLVIYFEQASSTLKSSYMDNARSIERVVEAIRLIESEPNVELIRVTVRGATSPEGSFAYNQRLGQNRAESFIDYFDQYITPDFFKIENIGENWRGLYLMVESSTMESRDEVLSIIANDSIFEGRELKLMNLDGGDPYMYMFEEFFPKLRKASYIQVFYDIKPNEEFVKIDRASGLIELKRYQLAIDLLQGVTPTPYTNNLIGVCYMQMEDLKNARTYLQRAIDGGSSDAKENLKRLNYQQDNIQYN